MTLPQYDELPVSAGDPPFRQAWQVFPNNGLGTLNNLTNERRLAATRLVHHGLAIGLDHPLDLDMRIFPTRTKYSRRVYELIPGGFYDEVIDGFSPQFSSQWDALGHVSSADGFFGGVPVARGTGAVASPPGIDAPAERGISGRGVLLDIARYRAGMDSPLDPNVRTEIGTDVLDRVAEAQGVVIGAGDILLLRFGVDDALHEIRAGRSSAETFRMDCPGLEQSEDTLRWLWNHHIAAVCADNVAVEVTPSLTFAKRLHPRLLGLLGLHLGELFDLQDLGRRCAEFSTYEFLFVSKPWFIPGGLGSPANALAIL